MKYIAVEGSIGAGKTTLAQMISQRYEALYMPEEFQGNPFLEKFYENPKQYGLQVELSFLADRYKQLKRFFHEAELLHDIIISDYIIEKCAIFASNNLQQDELTLYLKMYEIVKATAPKPDLIIHLHRPVDILLANIKKRGRSYEEKVTPTYLKQLEQRYAAYYKTSHSPVLIVDSDDRNFEDQPELLEKLWPYILDNEVDNRAYLSL